MKFIAEIDIMPLKELLDPQGKAVKLGLNNLGFQSVGNVRIGKHITLELEASSDGEARVRVEEACKKLLANLIMESYSYSVKQV